MKKRKNEEQPQPAAKAAPPYQNRVTLVGYLADAPDQRNSHAVLRMATKTSWKPKDSDEWQERTEWHRIVAWGKLAEAVKPLATGDHVLVEGELRSNEYEAERPVIGKKDVTAKVMVRTWEIRARAVRKLVHKKKEKAAA